MKYFDSLLIIIALFSITIESSNEIHCEQALEAYDYIISTYIDYEYNNINSDTIELYFIVEEESFDTVECNFSFLLASGFIYEELNNFIGDLYYIIDSNLIIIRGTDAKICHMLPYECGILTAEKVTNFREEYIILEDRLISSHDFGIRVSYTQSNKNISASKVGSEMPLFIFSDFF